MSGVSSMPPISSLQRYLTDAHDSLQSRKSEHAKHDKTQSAHHKAEHHQEHHEKAKVIDIRK